MGCFAGWFGGLYSVVFRGFGGFLRVVLGFGVVLEWMGLYGWVWVVWAA